MRSSIIAFAALALLVAGATVPSFGATSTPVDELRAASQRVQLQAAQTKGAPQQLLLMKKLRISGLLDRLERGQSVDPKEIDQLLEGQGAGR